MNCRLQKGDFFEMYEINPSRFRGQRVSEEKGETTESFNMVYLVLNKKIFSSYFILFPQC